jgi:hypothetical protein
MNQLLDVWRSQSYFNVRVTQPLILPRLLEAAAASVEKAPVLAAAASQETGFQIFDARQWLEPVTESYEPTGIQIKSESVKSTPASTSKKKRFKKNASRRSRRSLFESLRFSRETSNLLKTHHLPGKWKTKVPVSEPEEIITRDELHILHVEKLQVEISNLHTLKRHAISLKKKGDGYPEHTGLKWPKSQPALKN